MVVVDRINDYEDEISKLQQLNKASAAAVVAQAATAAPDVANSAISPAAAPVQASKFSYFMRKPASPALLDTISNNTSLTNEDLQKALDQEKQLRQEAESQVNKINGELDELSAQLFQQANEMVATERRARDKLEKRVAELEQKDREKMVRLGNIEKAVDRINRVRGLLGPKLESERG